MIPTGESLADPWWWWELLEHLVHPADPSCSDGMELRAGVGGSEFSNATGALGCLHPSSCLSSICSLFPFIGKHLFW